jgi:hypothetical protein
MKMLRAALIAGAATAALGLGLAALVLNPTLQTWVLRRYLAANPSYGATVGRVAVGLGHIRIEDLRVERGGRTLALPSAEIDLPLLGDLWSRELRIRGVSARGWTLDASRASSTPAERLIGGEPLASPELEALSFALALPNRFPSRVLGYKLSGIPGWGGLALEGSVILPSTGQGQAAGGALAVGLTGSPTTTGAAYSLNLSEGEHIFAAFRGHWTEANQRLAGRWKADVDGAGRVLAPTQGEGSFECTDAGVRLEGRLSAGASGFARILPQGDAAAAMRVSAQFDVVCRPGAWLVNQLVVEIGNRSPVLDVAALQAFEFNPSTRELSLADSRKDLARVSVRGLPVDWMGGWFSLPAISGGRLSGDLIATPRNGGLGLRSQGQLSVDGVTLAGAGGALARRLDVTADADAEIRPAGWQVDLASMEVKEGSARLAALHVKFGRLAGDTQPLRFAGRLSAGIPGLLALGPQPPVVPEGGMLDCMFTGASKAAGGIAAGFEAQIGISGLSSSEGPMPALGAAMRADFESDGRLVFSAPIHIDLEGRESDIRLSGTLVRTGDGVAMDLQATGTRLFVEDARLLAALVAPVGGGRPFWGGTSGQVAFAVKRASWPGNFEVADLNGMLRLGTGLVLFKDVHAGLDGGRVSLDGVLSPAAGASASPVFKADVTLDEFDFTPFFSALDSGRPPTLEGKFDATGHLTGTGWDLLHLPGRLQGEWKLTSKGGLFRALPAGVDLKAESPDKIAVLGKFIGTVADTVTFRKDPHSLERKARAVSEFSKAVTAIRYDRIDIALSRVDSQNIGIDGFSLISPEIRLEGVGSVVATPGAALLADPLELDLEMRARGHIADLLKTAGLLAADKDDLGYSACTLPFTIGGTLVRPDMGEFRDSLLKLMP